jgi:hypothetical protein
MRAELYSSKEWTIETLQLYFQEWRQKSDKKRDSSGEAAPAVPTRYMVSAMGRGLEGCIQGQCFDWLYSKKRLEST